MMFVKRPLALVLAASLPAGLSSVAMAQSDDDRWYDWTDDEVDAGDYEYEAGEGWHEEEWYDPSDWFDDDYNDGYWYDGTAWYEEPYDYYEWNDGYDPAWYGYSGYYDGYVDGYYDDDFGYDHWDTGWARPYRTSYTSGYYDGYYDSTEGYQYDPTYYYFTETSTGNDRESPRRRDESRERGDRANGKVGGKMSQKSGDRSKDKDVVRRRGTVESLRSADLDAAPSDHHVMRVRLENGKTVLADFGPKMDQSRLPFSEGDRVTICGERMSSGSQGYLKVHKIRTGDETVRLRPGPNHDGQKMSRTDREQGQSERNRSDRSKADRSKKAWSGQTTVEGRIQNVWRSARDVSGHALYRVELTGGKTVVVAVESQGAEKLRMREGDRVRIEGEKRQLGGREVIDVRRIRGQSVSGHSG